MFMQTIHSLHPLKFLLGGFDPMTLFSGIDFIEIIFSVLNQITFLVDILIAGALIAAIVRGIFKNFWKVLWRGVIYVLLLVLVVALAKPIGDFIGTLPIGLKGEVGTTYVEYTNLQEVIYNVILHSGATEAYALAFTEVVLKNLALFVGIPLAGLATTILSAITYPLFRLAIPKKLHKIKLIPVKLAISIGFSLIGIIVFALPMATLVPPMTEIKDVIAENTLMRKFLNPEFIGFLELFTSEKSFFLKIVSIGNATSSINVFNKFTVGGTEVLLKDALPALFQELNNIPYSPDVTATPLIP